MSALSTQFEQLVASGASAYAVVLVDGQTVPLKRDDANRTVGVSSAAFGALQKELQTLRQPILKDQFVATSLSATPGWSSGAWALGTVGEIAGRLSGVLPAAAKPQSFTDKLWARRNWFYAGAGVLVLLALINRVR